MHLKWYFGILTQKWNPPVLVKHRALKEGWAGEAEGFSESFRPIAVIVPPCLLLLLSKTFVQVEICSCRLSTKRHSCLTRRVLHLENSLYLASFCTYLFCSLKVSIIWVGWKKGRTIETVRKNSGKQRREFCLISYRLHMLGIVIICLVKLFSQHLDKIT